MSEPRRKRGRERVYDAQSTRETILGAAEAVFAQHGYDGTAVDAIAAQAGFNKRAGAIEKMSQCEATHDID